MTRPRLQTALANRSTRSGPQAVPLYALRLFKNYCAHDVLATSARVRMATNIDWALLCPESNIVCLAAVYSGPVFEQQCRIE